MAECTIGPITVDMVVHIHVPFGSNELFNISRHCGTQFDVFIGYLKITGN